MLAPAFYYGHAFAKPYFAPPPDSLWTYQLDEGLQLARQTGRPILMDFFANWCPPCLELDQFTFSQPQVRETAKKFIMVKIDCSVDDANCQKATERYEVVGWPTVLFLKSTGEPIEDVKLVGGFADKEKMLQLMREALAKAEASGL